MPLYDCQCTNGHIFERQIALARFDDPILCECGAAAKRRINSPVILSPIDYSYDCPITGKHITTKHSHEDNLKRHGCRVLEGGELEYKERERARDEIAVEKRIDATIERAVDEMPSEKREMLAKELSSGINLSVERK